MKKEITHTGLLSGVGIYSGKLRLANIRETKNYWISEHGTKFHKKMVIQQVLVGHIGNAIIYFANASSTYPLFYKHIPLFSFSQIWRGGGLNG